MANPAVKAKMQTCPALTPDPPNSAAGFTFVEVLIALLISLIIATTAAAALITILNMERTSISMQRTALAVQTMSTRYHLSTDPIPQPSDLPFSAPVQQDDWVIYPLTLSDDSVSMHHVLAFRFNILR